MEEKLTKEHLLHDMDLKACFYGSEYTPFVFKLFEKFSLYKDHPTTASGSAAAPREEEVMSKTPEEKNAEYYLDQYALRHLSVDSEYADIIRAMNRYADQKTEHLKSIIAEQSKEIEYLKNGIRRGEELYANLKFDDEPTGYQIALKTIADQAKEIEELKIACKWKQTQIEDLLNQQKDNSPF